MISTSEMIWNSSVWEEFASYNLEPSRNNLPPTVPPTVPPQKTTPRRQEALLALCQQQGFDAVSLVTCVGSLQKATTTEGRDLEMRHVWLQDLEAHIYIYIYIHRHITHGESWRRKVFWCMYLIDDTFLCISWTYDSISTGRKHQVQLQNYQNLVHIQDLKLLHGTAFNLVFLHRFIYQLQGRSRFDRTEQL